MFLLYIVLSVILIMLSILIFKKKINPFSVYAVLWLLLICLYASNIIQYNPITNYTWLIFYVVLIMFFLGSTLGYVLSGAYKQRKLKLNKESTLYGNYKRRAIKSDKAFKKRLEIIIVVLSLVSFVVAVYSLVKLIQAYGFNILSNIGTIYDDNINGNSIVESPRILLLNHIAIALSGYYISKYKAKPILIFPIINAIIDQLLSGSRGMLIVDLMFLAGPIVFFGIRNKMSRKIFTFMVFAIILFFVLITLFRGRNNTSLPYASSFLQTISSKTRLPYSIVSYVTLPLAAFNEFLQEPFSWNVGQSTFRLLYKLLTDINVERIDTFVYATPIKTNVYTYLGNLYADFGFIGILLGPFLLSTALSYTYYKLKVRKSIALVCVFDSLFVITIMSFFSWYVAYMYVVIVLLFGFGYFVVMRILNALLGVKRPKVVLRKVRTDS